MRQSCFYKKTDKVEWTLSAVCGDESRAFFLTSRDEERSKRKDCRIVIFRLMFFITCVPLNFANLQCDCKFSKEREK